MSRGIVSLGPEATVAYADRYSDPDGVIFVILSDGVHTTHVSLDGRRTTSTRDHLFDRARHPNKEWAIHVEPNSQEEAKVMSILRRWLGGESSSPGLAFQRGIVEAFVKRVAQRAEADRAEGK
jgi:hypothetical protein